MRFLKFPKNQITILTKTTKTLVVKEMQPVRGMKDWSGDEAWKREYVMERIKSIFQKYGYEPLETPAVEYFETLSAKGGGGDEIKDEIYYFKDKADRELGLRFDLTVPTARFVASNPTMPKPYKRYSIGKVWRYDRPQAGRYREFTQADIDIFGSDKPCSDLEITMVAIDVMRSLGFKDFRIRVNNRKVLEAMVLAAGIPEDKVLDAFRAIDKLDKIGWDGITEELKERNVPNYEKLVAMIKSNDLEKIRTDLEKFDAGKQGLEELGDLLELVGEMGLEKWVNIDLTLVRGLEYYTGNVFEIQAGGQWSCGGGGRYDRLVETYKGRPTPAIGISFGVERVIQLMEENNLFPENYKPTLVYIAPVNAYKEAWEIRKKLIDLGLSCDIDLMRRKLNKQFDYAKGKGYKWMLIVGEMDVKSGVVTLKNLETREEQKIKLDELESIKQIIST